MKFRAYLIAMLVLLVVALPAAAQSEEMLTVSTGGIQITVDKDFATGVAINTLPADDPTNGPGFAEPTSTQIAFINPPPGFAPESILTLRLYRTADFADYPEHQARQTQLQGLLEDMNPDALMQFMQPAATMPGNPPLPFIPVYPHGSALQARAGFFETPMFRGVRYIGAFAAAAEPFNSRSFIYTYQGISDDGSVYLSAQAFIDTTLFPNEPGPIDPATFVDNFGQYVQESIATLNAGTPEDFSPNLADVDAIVQAITVTPIMP
jgi:hypothetical protein